MHITLPWSAVANVACVLLWQVGHGHDAFFWTDEYESPPTCVGNERDTAGYQLQGCRMVNGMGLVVGKYGRILRTTDGGHTWENVPSPTTAHLHSISMNEENTHSGSEYYDPQARKRCILPIALDHGDAGQLRVLRCITSHA